MDEIIVKEKVLQLHSLLNALNAYGSVSLPDLKLFECLLLGSFNFITTADLSVDVVEK